MGGKSLSTVPDFPWKVAYTEALLETDNARPAELISVLQGTVLLRLLELAKGNEEELQAVEYALDRSPVSAAEEIVNYYILTLLPPLMECHRFIPVESVQWGTPAAFV